MRLCFGLWVSPSWLGSDPLASQLCLLVPCLRTVCLYACDGVTAVVVDEDVRAFSHGFRRLRLGLHFLV